MKKILLILLFLLMPAACFADGFAIQSTSWQDGATMGTNYLYNGFGCTGKNISPQIKWSNPPEGAKSFAVTLYDPDAPTGSGWWHWVVFNLPADVRELEEGASTNGTLPSGAVQSRTDFGTTEYGGACPPRGDNIHRYILTVYALKVSRLDLNSDASGAMVGYYLNQNTLGKSSIKVIYVR